MGIQDYIDELTEKNIIIWTEGDNIKYKAPKGTVTSKILESIKSRKAEILQYFGENDDMKFTKNHKLRYEKFPLTNIQNSYVMGRNNLYELGGVGCHGYIEVVFDEILDRDKIETAWNKVIQKHDMLRAIILNSEYQIVQEAVPYVKVPCIDLREANEGVIKEREDLCNKLANKQYELGEWPMCDLALSIENKKSIIHFSLDMLIADFVSMNIILNDLELFYRNSDMIIIPTTLYRDVVIYQSKQKSLKSMARREAELYWNKKIREMGEAPDLPVLSNNNDNFKFFQKKVFIDNKLWNSFCSSGSKHRVTPSVLIMSCLSEIISLWSSNNKFCINTTLLNRPNISDDIDKIVGDFTDVNITSVELNYKNNFIERVQSLQETLWNDLEHNAVSGVEVLRKLTKQRKKNVIIPVVFTSTLGVSSKNDMTVKKAIGNKLSQTPQVYIDCQASEENSGATINWDIREGIFDECVIDDMFESFKELILSICKEADKIFLLKHPAKLPYETVEIRTKVNNTQKNIQPMMLEDGFLNSLKKYPKKTALITEDGEYTYKKLSKYVVSIINILNQEHVKKGDTVGINIDKGVWQIAAVLATLIVKATYVPIDFTQPTIRKKKIINKAGIKLVFSQEEEIELQKDCKLVNVSSISIGNMEDMEIIKINDIKTDKDYDRPAYIIFTSGTTGEPKGVIISHRAAMNTICDVNQRYNINKNDIFLGLANLSFDLSVYDIFGCFMISGTLVLPNSDKIKDSKYLADLVLVQKITIWNSVPAQMQMFINYLESVEYNSNINIKLILLSGDWIPVNLPKRIYSILNNTKVVSLGGATEASIWSILYDIEQDKSFEKSIPYGKPMYNQKFYILDENMQHCPNYVDGSLYIGGVGLSLGYLNDEKQNKEKYCILQETQERVYKTGDRGCYRKDGVIIFKGRDKGDEQVKIHGHRVELPEIRSVLNEHPSINSAVTLAIGDTPDNLHINAVVSPMIKNNLGDIVDDEEENKLLKGIGSHYENSIDENLFKSWLQKSDMVVIADIYNTFKTYGIFNYANIAYSFDEIIEIMNTPKKLYKLIKRWLNVLVEEKVIILCDEKYKAINTDHEKLNSSKLWNEFYKIEEKFNYSKSFLDYLKKSSDLLPQLVQGKENPLDVLFPKGDVGPAMAAYHDNKINKMLNYITKKEIQYLCKKQNRENSSEVFRILEIGAGVGGTSIDVIPEIDGCKVEYYFTDLSTFFLNKAQENFKDYNWVKYGIFDINEEFGLQGYEAFSFDLILCANVLHNSKDVHYVMENLKGMLKEQGSMIILEETQTSYMLLTSMEFKDGLTGFLDERKDKDQTFFTRSQWENIFNNHKGKIVYEFPNKKSKLDLLGQTIYITRFVGEYKAINKKQIKEYLENTVSSYMVPNDILVLPNIPLTANKKIDNKKLKDYFIKIENNVSTKEQSELPQTDLERRIEEIWCKELNIKSIGRNDNFYLVGGDSLLIAQVIGQMLKKLPEIKGWEWSTLLTEMMQAPTIRQISEKIEEFQKDKNSFIDPCLVHVKRSNESNDNSVAKVLFHAGTGTLTPYNNLLSYIEKDSKNNESILGFTFGNDADYISMETSKTFNLLGEKYGKILSDLGYSKYILIGHCVGGLIALEAAHYLKNKGKCVSDVTLISAGIPRKKEKTILSDTTDEIYKKTLQSSLDNELLLERIFAKLINANEYKAGYTIDEERLQKYIEYLSRKGTGDITVEALCNGEGEYEDVAAEFCRQSSKSISERLNALYNTIEKPDGELMEHQLKMLNILFRIFSQNFRCVASYEPAPYCGNMRIFCCEIQGNHFYPGFFQEDYETWKPYAKGKLYYSTIAGQHFDCITEPNLEENVKKILKFMY
ncbi:non-ribosomal peptide synthetase [Clostridium niameyense]|uniref:non-ribosomal peptide synthetase n=1 Tax=Clostridium niameyense TaxID=1622073 RepID=UPI00067E89D7|nr:non-ribosomal peptide synthetase [Clostridium niameyense]